MGLRGYVIGLLLVSCATLAGCGGPTTVDQETLEGMAGGELGERVPVSGVVTVDGTPAAGVNIYAYVKDGGRKVARECRTDADGKYCWSTHTNCDGMKPGTYVLGFAHMESEGRGSSGGNDALKGKYRNPAKSGFELVVESGVEQADVNYDLVSGE